MIADLSLRKVTGTIFELTGYYLAHLGVSGQKDKSLLLKAVTIGEQVQEIGRKHDPQRTIAARGCHQRPLGEKKNI